LIPGTKKKLVSVDHVVESTSQVTQTTNGVNV